MGIWFWLVNLVKGKGKMTTNKKILEKLDLIEKNLKKEIDSLRTDNETRFNELDKRTKLQEDISNLKLKLKDNDSIIEKYANEVNNLKSINKKDIEHIAKVNKKCEELVDNLEKANKRIEELESSSYLRIELEPDKPKRQKMSIKKGSKSVAVTKILKEVSENNLSEEK